MKDKIKELILSITEEELEYISNADYGIDADKHKESLRKLIFEQEGVVRDNQHYYPYEVIELTAWVLQEEHEREFAICNCIIAKSILAGADSSNNSEYIFETINDEYNKLPEPLKKILLDALAMC